MKNGGKEEKMVFFRKPWGADGGRKRQADKPGPGRMNLTVQRPGSISSIGELLLLIYKAGFC